MPPANNSAHDLKRSLRAWALVFAISLAILFAASWPYWLAYRVSGEYVFTGILINPADGNSYLAKMHQGWNGSWRFTLPYTAEPGPGALIFTWYLFLGHLARWTGASLDLVYALARAGGGLALLLSAYVFLGHFLPEPRARLSGWLLFALGSGLGWLAVPLGAFTSDLWVAEAFPFLAVFSNAHFGLATALLLWILHWSVPGLAPDPPALRPHAKLPPCFATTSDRSTSPPAAATGVRLGSSVPLPNTPSSFSPQQRAAPFASTAQDWTSPTATPARGPGGPVRSA